MIVQKQGLRQLDWVILGSALLICVGGILAIKSARHLDLHPLDMVRKQAVGRSARRRGHDCAGAAPIMKSCSSAMPVICIP